MTINSPATCTVPPVGWYCTRPAGHEGPCAAYPTTPTPVEAAEAGERERQIRDEISRRLSDHARLAERPNDDTLMLDYLLNKLTASRTALESTFQHAARVQQELAEARAGWVPVGERLPEREERAWSDHVLVALANGMVHIGQTLSDGRWFFPASGHEPYQTNPITHWRPMPAPPTTATKPGEGRES